LLADQAAVAIENTRLYREQHTHRRQAEALRRSALALVSTIKLDEVIDRILNELQQVVPYDSASVQLLKGDYLEIIDGRGHSNPDQIVGHRFYLGDQETSLLNKRVIETKKPMIIDNTAQYPAQFARKPHADVRIQSWLAVPMLIGQEVIGLLALDKQQTHFYSEPYAYVAETYAAQAAVAIQNAQLHQSTTESLAQLTRLYELSTEFVSTLSLGAVAQRVIEKIVAATEAHSAVLNLMDQDGKLEMTLGPEEPGPRPNGTTLQIMNSGQALIYQASDPDTSFPEHLRQLGIQTSIGLPLKAVDKTIGVLFVRYDQPRSFSRQAKETLFIFANQTAIAIQNARLYERAQQEITERKRVEAELNEYHEQLEDQVANRTAALQVAMTEATTARDKIDAILHSVADGLIVTDLEHRIVLANSAASALLDIPQSEEFNQTREPTIKHSWLRDLVHSSSKHQIKDCEIEIKLTDPNTSQIKIMYARTALVDDRQGNPLGAVTIIRDVTRLREIDRLKTEFLSIAAHELRTPLTTVLGFSELMLDRSYDEARQQRYLSMIHDQATHLSEIVNNLLDIARLEAGRGLEINLEPINMGEILKNVAQPFIASTTKHNITLEGLAELPLVVGDSFRLRQVGKNLLSNAVKYSPQGGNIIVRSQIQDQYIEFSIQDEGIGMTIEQQQHLFERFYRADASNTAIGGTGLGLAISKLIIDLHESQIWVKSEKNVGTTVYFTLPIVTNPNGSL